MEDTREWNIDAQRSYELIVEQGGKVADTMRAFWTFFHGADMMAYLAMMAPRLVELKRVLNETGSIYLHRDPTASHYLKILMDAVFGPQRFLTEITWKRSSAHSDGKQGRKQHGRIRDTILFYSKGADWTWNPVYAEYDEEYLNSFYKYVEEGSGRRYRLGDLTGLGGEAKGNPGYEVMGVTRYWRYTKEKMEKVIEEVRVI
ncbi:MAG: DNA methyltransferase [Terracidiphilus sp.]